MEKFFERRRTREVKVGDIGIGGDNPIRVQSMITEDTGRTDQAVNQIINLHRAGAEIVRVTAPNMNDAKNLKAIRKAVQGLYGEVPLVADVHHRGSAIAVEAAKHVDKVRINPGLFVFHKKEGKLDEYSQVEIDRELEEIDATLAPVIQACKDEGTAMRIGVNHGSLANRLTVMYGDTPEGMVESAMEYIRICERNDFRDIVVSMKASRVPVMENSNRLLARRMAEEGMDYPIHLGVTEAGKDQYARVKSAIGIGTLLSEGIGDTIRVSLAEDPIEEISVCNDILQARGLKKTKAEIIACPGCGRTKFDLRTVTDQVTEAVGHLRELDVAVMGCVVNGPGENADADYGYIGMGGGKIQLRRGEEPIKLVPQEIAVNELVNLIKSDGKWVDPPEEVDEPKQVKPGPKLIPITPIFNNPPKTT